MGKGPSGWRQKVRRLSPDWPVNPRMFYPFIRQGAMRNSRSPYRGGRRPNTLRRVFICPAWVSAQIPRIAAPSPDDRAYRQGEYARLGLMSGRRLSVRFSLKRKNAMSNRGQRFSEFLQPKMDPLASQHSSPGSGPNCDGAFRGRVEMGCPTGLFFRESSRGA